MRLFKSFKPFNRCAPLNPLPCFDVDPSGLSSPATRGRVQEGVDRFEGFERLELFERFEQRNILCLHTMS
jgi:hypothetical protein